MATLIKNRWLRGLAMGLLVLVSVAGSFPVNYAGDVFALDIWKLTIPLDDDGDGVADEVTMPTLRNFEDPGFFLLSKTGDSICFRARCSDVTAAGSVSSHSQLREIKKNTGTAANWGSNDGQVHNMTITLAFNAVPKTKPEVVAAGIYAGDDAVFTICLEGKRLLLKCLDFETIVLEESYVTGTMVDLMIIIDSGRIRAFRGSTQLKEWPCDKKELHFRAGCEVPANPARASTTEFGEVEIQKLFVTHEPK